MPRMFTDFGFWIENVENAIERAEAPSKPTQLSDSKPLGRDLALLGRVGLMKCMRI